MAVKEQGPENHCPYGCGTADMDDHGFCRHLVGFTNNGKTYEALGRNNRGARVIQATTFNPVTGRYTRVVHTLQKGDKVVNPTEEQHDRISGVTHIAEKWSSSRVYRKNVPDEEAFEDLDANEPEEVLAG